MARPSPHNLKTADMREFLAENTSPQPTVGEACDETMKAVGKHHEALENKTPAEKKEALDCLTLIILSYLAACAKPVQDSPTSKPRQPTIAEIRGVKVRT